MRNLQAFRLALLMAGVALAAGAAAAQQRPHRAGFKRVTVSALTAQGFEVKAITGREALILQKGEQVYWCGLRVADTSPLSYQSDCYAIR
jgi:ribosomal protein S12